MPLKNAWNTANEPLVPEEPVRRLGEQMTTPHLDESPTWAKLKGFGAGALEGLRQQTSPVNIVSNLATMIPAASMISRGVKAARGGAALLEAPQAAHAVAPTMDLLGELPQARQVLPSGGDVDALTGALKYSLAKVPNAKNLSDAVQGLQEAAPQALHHAPEFAPVGGEASFNAGRDAAQPFLDPIEQAYQRIRGTMGTPAKHSSQAIQDISHPGAQQMIEKLHGEARPTFAKLQQEGAFNGLRSNR